MNLSIEPNPGVTFKVRHQDDDLLVVEKRSGLATQPGKGHATDTLLNGLFALAGDRLQNLGKARDFGLLHRLDKDTSGLLVVGLSVRAYDALRAAFEGRAVKKFYWALCARAPKDPSGVIRLPIAETAGAGAGQTGRTSTKLARIAHGASSAAVAASGLTGGPGIPKPAVTAYRTLRSSPTAALVEARAVTGRLHQVRVHLEAIGCPIFGDPFYANRSVAAASPRLALHAHRLAFTHPVTGEPVDVRSPWPADLRRLLKRVGLEKPDA